MKLIDKDRFLEYKRSDTLVIWGSGSSIKSLTKDDFNYLNNFDSISTTAFSKSGIQTTFYIVGEILFNYYRAKHRSQRLGGEQLYKLYEEAGDSPNDYIQTFKRYPNTCLIVWNDKWTLHDDHMDVLESLDNDCILVNQYGHQPALHMSGLTMDDSTGPSNKFVDKSLYTEDTLLEKKIWLHPWKGINAPIYFAKCMGYKKVIFVGVDLTAGPLSYGYDRKKFVELVGAKLHDNHKNSTVHPCKDMLFKFIKYLKSDIRFTTYNQHSPLTEIIDVDEYVKSRDHDQ